MSRPSRTVREALQEASEFFIARGVASPSLEAEHLLAHCLDTPRLNLRVDPGRRLSAATEAAFSALALRRGNREPLQHLVGSVSFCGIELKVDRCALIPRPETEGLAERGWTFLENLEPDAGDVLTALDFGTGTGCLAVAVAKRVARLRVAALDRSLDALQLARANAAAHGVSDRIQAIQGDGLAAFAPGRRFHLVIANPPYIPTGDIAGLEPEVRDHDPRLALDGGPDGLTFARQLASGAGRLLRPGGCLMMEFGDGQAESLRTLFEGAGCGVLEVASDLSGRPRILIARPRKT